MNDSVLPLGEITLNSAVEILAPRSGERQQAGSASTAVFRMKAATEIVAHLRTLASPRDAEGQRRFGITPGVELLGIRAPVLRAIARAHRRDHALALELWQSGIHRLDSPSARWIAADALRELTRVKSKRQ